MLNDVYKILYPNGAAFKTLEGGFRSKVHESVDYALNEFFEIKDSFFNGLYPDNDLITVEEVDFLSYIYGLEYPDGTTFLEKKDLLLNRMNRSGAANYKQSAIYIEKVLNDFGFDVMVTENVNQEIPAELKTNNVTQHSFSTPHGFGIQHGLSNFNLISNSQYPKEIYNQGSGNNWAVFFITGKAGLNEAVPVSNSKIIQFRELVLRLKPAHTVALINYQPDLLSVDFNNDFNNDFLI